MKILLYLLAFFSSFDAFAECADADIRKLTNSFFRDVAPLSGVPEVARTPNIKNILTKKYLLLIQEAKEVEDVSTRLVISMGEDAWPSEEHFFLGGTDGFNGYKIKNIGSEKAIVDLSGEALDGSPISWSQSLIFVEEDGQCLVDDVLYESGNSSRGLFASQKGQYQKIIEIYQKKSVHL